MVWTDDDSKIDLVQVLLLSPLRARMDREFHESESETQPFANPATADESWIQKQSFATSESIKIKDYLICTAL